VPPSRRPEPAPGQAPAHDEIRAPGDDMAELARLGVEAVGHEDIARNRRETFQALRAALVGQRKADETAAPEIVVGMNAPTTAGRPRAAGHGGIDRANPARRGPFRPSDRRRQQRLDHRPKPPIGAAQALQQRHVAQRRQPRLLRPGRRPAQGQPARRIEQRQPQKVRAVTHFARAP
jgi:hypothetical protein